jgi:hypothetical protein
MVMTNNVKEYSSVPQRNIPMTTGQTLNAQRNISHGPLRPYRADSTGELNTCGGGPDHDQTLLWRGLLEFMTGRSAAHPEPRVLLISGLNRATYCHVFFPWNKHMRQYHSQVM